MHCKIHELILLGHRWVCSVYNPKIVLLDIKCRFCFRKQGVRLSRRIFSNATYTSDNSYINDQGLYPPTTESAQSHNKVLLEAYLKYSSSKALINLYNKYPGSLYRMTLLEEMKLCTYYQLAHEPHESDFEKAAVPLQINDKYTSAVFNLRMERRHVHSPSVLSLPEISTLWTTSHITTLPHTAKTKQ